MIDENKIYIESLGLDNTNTNFINDKLYMDNKKRKWISSNLSNNITNLDTIIKYWIMKYVLKLIIK